MRFAAPCASVKSNKQNRFDGIFSAHRVHWRPMRRCDRDGKIVKKPQHADSIVVVVVVVVAVLGCAAPRIVQNAIQCHLNSLFTLYIKFHYFIRSGTVYLSLCCALFVRHETVGALFIRLRRRVIGFFGYFESIMKLLWCCCAPRGDAFAIPDADPIQCVVACLCVATMTVEGKTHRSQCGSRRVRRGRGREREAGAKERTHTSRRWKFMQTRSGDIIHQCT